MIKFFLASDKIKDLILWFLALIHIHHTHAYMYGVYYFLFFIFIVYFLAKQNRCVNMIAHLFNAPLGDSEAAVGVGTVGSSEAIMLAGLAFKRKWQNRRKAEGKPYDKPNIVTGANVQVYP